MKVTLKSEEAPGGGACVRSPPTKTFPPMTPPHSEHSKRKRSSTSHSFLTCFKSTMGPKRKSRKDYFRAYRERNRQEERERWPSYYNPSEYQTGAAAPPAKRRRLQVGGGGGDGGVDRARVADAQVPGPSGMQTQR